MAKYIKESKNQTRWPNFVKLEREEIHEPLVTTKHPKQVVVSTPAESPRPMKIIELDLTAKYKGKSWPKKVLSPSHYSESRDEDRATKSSRPKCLLRPVSIQIRKYYLHCSKCDRKLLLQTDTNAKANIDVFRKKIQEEAALRRAKLRQQERLAKVQLMELVYLKKQPFRIYVKEFSDMNTGIQNMTEQDRIFHFFNGLGPKVNSEMIKKEYGSLKAAINRARECFQTLKRNQQAR